MRKFTAITVGNSTIKLARFIGSEIVEKHSIASNASAEALLGAVKWTSEWARELVMISVNPSTAERFIMQMESTPSVLTTADFPLRSEYVTMSTLGVDRAAAVYGALALYKHHESALLVIDLGTAFTFNAVTTTGVFLGGAIAPGIAALMRGLTQSTAELPIQDAQFPPEVIGRSTTESIQSGVMNTALHSVVGITADMKALLGANLHLVLTGGSYDALNARLTEGIGEHTYDPDLVLRGVAELYARVKGE